MGRSRGRELGATSSDHAAETGFVGVSDTANGMTVFRKFSLLKSRPNNEGIEI